MSIINYHNEQNIRELNVSGTAKSIKEVQKILNNNFKNKNIKNIVFSAEVEYYDMSLNLEDRIFYWILSLHKIKVLCQNIPEKLIIDFKRSIF